MAASSITCMWSRTDRAEFRDIPRSADGPPHTSPILRGRPISFSAAIRSSATARTSDAAQATLRLHPLNFKLRLPKQDSTLSELGELRNDLRAAERAFASLWRVARPEPRPNDAITEREREREGQNQISEREGQNLISNREGPGELSFPTVGEAL